MQRQVELQITGQDPERFIFCPTFTAFLHAPDRPPWLSHYRDAYYAMAAFNVLLLVALIVILVRTSLHIQDADGLSRQP